MKKDAERIVSVVDVTGSLCNKGIDALWNGRLLLVLFGVVVGSLFISLLCVTSYGVLAATWFW